MIHIEKGSFTPAPILHIVVVSTSGSMRGEALGLVKKCKENGEDKWTKILGWCGDHNSRKGLRFKILKRDAMI